MPAPERTVAGLSGRDPRSTSEYPRAIAAAAADPWFTSASRASFRLVDLASAWRGRNAPPVAFPVLVSHPAFDANVLERAMVHSLTAGRPVSVDELARYAVGREEANDLSIDDPTVSRRHAVLVRKVDRRLSLVDSGSSNGTFLDGLPLEPGRPVDVPGGLAVIRFGPHARFALMDEPSFDAFVEAVPDKRGTKQSETRRASARLVRAGSAAARSVLAEHLIARLLEGARRAGPVVRHRVTVDESLDVELASLEEVVALARNEPGSITRVVGVDAKGASVELYRARR